ncbi:MAG: glycosyltransferase [Phycisphaerae bacterium]
MTAFDDSFDFYRRGLEHAQSGEDQQALQCIQEYLLRVPHDTDALNDAGVLLHALGRQNEAARHLEAALDLLPDRPKEILWNLAEIYLAADRLGQARRLVCELTDQPLFASELANRIASLYLEQDRIPQAIETLLQSLEIHPDQQQLTTILDRLRKLRPKLAIIADPGDEESSGLLTGHLSQRFRTRRVLCDDTRSMAEALDWCDIACFSSLNDGLLRATRQQGGYRTVVHLSPEQLYSPRLERVCWDRVDMVLTPAGTSRRDLLRSRIGTGSCRIEPIGEAPLTDTASLNPCGGKAVAAVGPITLADNPMLLLQCFQALHEQDDEYTLHLAGTMEDEMLEHYLRNLLEDMGLTEAVFFEGWQEDLDAWLGDKSLLVSTGIVQDRMPVVLQAMLSGIKPVIHRFPDAEELLPEDVLFTTVEEFCRRVLDEPAQPERYRMLVRTDHCPHRRMDRIHQLISELAPVPGRSEVFLSDASWAGIDAKLTTGDGKSAT